MPNPVSNGIERKEKQGTDQETKENFKAQHSKCERDGKNLPNDP